jgi:hypothetical protein
VFDLIDHLIMDIVPAQRTGIKVVFICAGGAADSQVA